MKTIFQRGDRVAHCIVVSRAYGPEIKEPRVHAHLASAMCRQIMASDPTATAFIHAITVSNGPKD